jgi:uncharacterized iron-regulated protein
MMIRFKFFVALVLLFAPVIARASESPSQAPTEYQLDVAFDVPNSKIMGTARINAPAGKELIVRTGALKIIEVQRGGHKIGVDIHNGILKLGPAGEGTITIVYEGVFKGGKDVTDTNYEVVPSVIDERGISLTGLWYPSVDGLSLYHLSATLPEGFTAVSEAEKIRKSVNNGQVNFIFDFPHPAGGINLVAARKFEEIKSTVNGTGIYAYFFREDLPLAGSYIEHAKKYIRLYEDLLGKYPFKRFSIVENFLPYGYSMPSFTLLGRDVVRLPFIVETSLGHEVLHQWFGNLVYVDYDKGNWAEGLTSYLAGHLYEEKKGRGWEYRKQILIDYESYVHENNEFPVKKFTGRTDFASKAIGYGKAAMVFHMLRRGMGDDAFNRSLRDLVREKRFQRASWDDIRSLVEKNSGKNWGWFFKQWIDGPGIPELNIGAFDLKQKGTKYEATFTVVQKSKVYTLELPLTVSYVDGSEENFTVPADKDSTLVTLSLNGMPEKIIFDRGYDVARRLAGNELPPVVAGVIGAEKPVIVMPVKDKETYGAVIEAFRERGAADKSPSEVNETVMKSSTLILLGNDNPVVERLFGSIRNDAGFSVTVKNNPWAPGKVVGVINGKSREEVEEAFGKIFHYGKYSELCFDSGKNYIKKIEETDRGINVEHKDNTAAILVSAVTSPPEVFARVSGKRIVYVGEYHDRVSNHAVQLEVTRYLHRKNKKIAIGMEMFQRPFQKVLDDYIAGTIDEKAMLKGTEYYKRWGFDYNLYRPILTFAREEKIPLIALNIRSEITDKVSKGGIDSLSEEEKREIPPQMDFSDEDYERRLREVFRGHKGSKANNFDFFYQAQILWDESMSQSLDYFLKGRPDFQTDGQLVVIAGSGHLFFGSGIPRRTFRRNGLDYAIILNDTEIEKDIADYLIFPESMEGVTTPKIMAMLSDNQGKPTITNFPEGSISEKAGLKEGDVILSIDAVPVKTVDDIRIELLFKKRGDLLKVKILRKRFLLGDTEKEFDFVL